MTATTIRRATGPLILGLGILASAAQVAANDEEDLDAAYNSGSVGSDWFNNVTIGGYGELHLNLNKDDANEIDYHRWVLFINHRFSDKIVLYSEFELEHSLAGDGKPGEVELEQAYIDIAMNGGTSFKAGLFLLPVGTLNETHEPDTFYGVERNPVEKNIIPTTWWEAGIGLSGSSESVSWDVAVHSGLAVPDSYKIRSGRKKVAEAPAEDAAVTGRVTYSGNGFKVAGFAQYQGDITQGRDEGADATLIGATLDATIGAIQIKGLVSSWDIGGAAAAAAGADEQWGYFIEPSYKISDNLGVFARYAEYQDYTGSTTDVVTVGVNYWPIDQVVFKADYNDAGGEESFNLGVGYSF